MKLKIGGVIPDSQIYGPGSRYTIWLQGCSIRCKGCWNQQFWTTEGGFFKTIDEIYTEIHDVIDRGDASGVTFLGGEPLDQINPLLALMHLLKKDNVSMMLYTGYEMEEINNSPLMTECIQLSSIAIVGRYVEELRSTSLRWRGSKNQEIIISDPLLRQTLDLKDMNEVEIHLHNNGFLNILGYPEKNYAKELKEFGRKTYEDS